eukprot:5208068-Pyramimonas_sp.AAC.1
MGTVMDGTEVVKGAAGALVGKFMNDAGRVRIWFARSSNCWRTLSPSAVKCRVCASMSPPMLASNAEVNTRDRAPSNPPSCPGLPNDSAGGVSKSSI